MSKFLKPVLIEDVDNARVLLSTIISSVFSLLVFSFSMVMIVLNLASSSLSPRVLPGLISQKSHQVVLGTYIGTIIYSYMLLINLRSESSDNQVPSLGILLAMIFTLVCLSLFVYFIDSISNYIQADSIIRSIFKDTSKALKRDKETENQLTSPNTDGWHPIAMREDGYLKVVNYNTLASKAKELEFLIRVVPQVGDHLLEGDIAMYTNKPVDDKIEEELLNVFDVYIEERVSDHFVFGFKLLSEIAVKALSPGINDPGTAVKAVDKISILLRQRIGEPPHSVICDSKGDRRVYYTDPTVHDILFNFIAPIRTYGRADTSAMMRLVQMTYHLAVTDLPNLYHHAALSEFNALLESSVKEHIDGEHEKKGLLRSIARTKSILQRKD